MLLLVPLLGCGLIKKEPDELTNAYFSSPETVKRNTMIELAATYKRGANGKLLSYRWSMDGSPTGSSPLLEQPDAQVSRFMGDVFGEYTVTLVVDDGRNESAPVTH